MTVLAMFGLNWSNGFNSLKIFDTIFCQNKNITEKVELCQPFQSRIYNLLVIYEENSLFSNIIDLGSKTGLSGAILKEGHPLWWIIIVLFVYLMVFNTTFKNISIISWRSVLLLDETGRPGENHQPVASHWSNFIT